MDTKLIKIEDRMNIRDEELLEAAQVIRDGGLVAFPTETVYGLGANALDEEAAKKIYAAKGRPSDNPLIAHISCMEELEPLVAEIPETGRKLAEAFWPGPLTLVFPKSQRVPYGTTGGLETVAVRMPSDPAASRLIALAGVPIAAPSANTSGRPSPTTAEHVWQDMNGKIEMILDGGPVGIGVESTIVDVSGEIPTLLRPGAVTIEMLRELLGNVEIDPAILGPLHEDVKPKAPGMKYRHYAPKAQLLLVELEDKGAGDEEAGREVSGEAGKVVDGESGKVVSGELSIESADNQRRVAEKIMELAREKMAAGYRVGIICTDESRDYYTEGIVRSLGLRAREETIAHNLFAVLREYDDLEVDYIFSESFSKEALGQAIMNRLTKAAGYRIITV